MGLKRWQPDHRRPHPLAAGEGRARPGESHPHHHRETALHFQESLIEAALADRRGEQQALTQADVDLTKLRFYLRLCQDLEIIDRRRYRHVSEMVSEVGRLLGGWRKKAFGT